MKSTRDVLEFCQMVCLDLMFVAHLLNGSRQSLMVAAFHEREEHKLLAMHVAVEVALDTLEEICQADWCIGVIAMHPFDLGRERDQRDEFRAVGVVVACPDMIDQIDRFLFNLHLFFFSQLNRLCPFWQCLSAAVRKINHITFFGQGIKRN